jgi:D-beta-D-heptose 7-phosphate kinase/D-beta-D-heptose 1-phosphate adenosyltransferase
VTRVDAAPILSLDEAVEQCRSWHDHGLRIVLTNGAFDLLHVGHLRYLEDAASHADRLVVALNTDHSVQLSKGPDRPIVPQAERAEMIATVRCVDLVVPFDDRTWARCSRPCNPMSTPRERTTRWHPCPRGRWLRPTVGGQ